MGATILDGKAVAAAVKAEVAVQVAKLDRPPGLATVLVGDDPASHTYVRGKRKDAEECGMRSFHHELPADTDQRSIERLVDSRHEDTDVHGILVQLPLPSGLNSEAITERIAPGKDVDGLHPYNLGLLLLDRPGLRPCTPSGVMQILEHYGLETSGTKSIVVGRSFLVGRPMALMLSARGVDSTVTIAHSRTPDLAAQVREADIVVAAVGVPRMISGEMIKPGAIVIDIGINRVGGKLVGDVDFASATEVAGAITPVPGGVGPMTRAMLMANTLAAARS